MKPQRIQFDEPFVRSMFIAQMRFTANMMNQHLANDLQYLSDDSHDDLDAALDLTNALRAIYYDLDTEWFDALFNTDPENMITDRTHLGMYACGGLCPELSDLDCISLAEEA